MTTTTTTTMMDLKKERTVSFAPRSRLTALYVYDSESSIVEYRENEALNGVEGRKHNEALVAMALLAYYDPEEEEGEDAEAAEEEQSRADYLKKDDFYKLDKLTLLDDDDDDDDDDQDYEGDTVSTTSDEEEDEEEQPMEQGNAANKATTNELLSVQPDERAFITASAATIPLPTPTATINYRSGWIKYYKSNSISSSVVFRRQREHKATLLQAWWRARYTRIHFHRVVANHVQQRIRQKQSENDLAVQREQARQCQLAATQIQSMLRGIHQQRKYAILLQRARAIVPIQATARRFIQRAWMQRLGYQYIHLMRIQQQEQRELQHIQQTKDVQTTALRGKVLRKFSAAHATATDKAYAALDQQKGQIQQQKEYWRRENQLVRAGMADMERDIARERIKQERLQAALASTLKQGFQVQAAVDKLQRSNRRLEAELQDLLYQQEHVQIQRETIQEHVQIETKQRLLYDQAMTGMVRNLIRHNYADKLLIFELQAIATQDPQAAQQVRRERQLQTILQQKQADLCAIANWKQEQMNAAQQEIAAEYEAADEGHALRCRHVDEHRMYLQTKRDIVQHQATAQQHAIRNERAEMTKLKHGIAHRYHSQQALQHECQQLVERQQKLKESQKKLLQALCEQRAHLERAVQHYGSEARTKQVLEKEVYHVMQTVQQRLHFNSNSKGNHGDQALMDSLFYLLGRLRQFETSRGDDTQGNKTKMSMSSSLALPSAAQQVPTRLSPPSNRRKSTSATRRMHEEALTTPPSKEKKATTLCRAAVAGTTGERYTRVVLPRDE